MLDRSKVKQLARIENHLSDFNVYAIESELKGVTYGYWKDHLVIFTLTGDMAVRYDEIPIFIRWLRNYCTRGYIPVNMPVRFGRYRNRVVISHGAYGRMSLFLSRMDEFLSELDGIHQDIVYRKAVGVRGA